MNIMVNMEPLVEALKKIKVTVESPRMDRTKGTDGEYIHTPFENPKMYPFGFELYVYTDNIKQRKAITRAVELSWFTFKNRIPCVLREVMRVDRQTRRHVISAAWPRQKEEDHDEVGQMFIDVLAAEISEPGSSDLLIDALEHADQIIDEMLGKMSTETLPDPEEESEVEEEVSENDDSASCSCMGSVDCNIRP
jgi:hypothetical protein